MHSTTSYIEYAASENVPFDTVEQADTFRRFPQRRCQIAQIDLLVGPQIAIFWHDTSKVVRVGCAEVTFACFRVSATSF